MVMDKLQQPGERQRAAPPSGSRKTQPCQQLDLSLLVSRTVREHVSVVSATPSVCFVRTVLANEPSIYVQHTQGSRNPHFYPECLLNPIPLNVFTSPPPPPPPPGSPRFLIPLGETVKKAKEGKRTLKAQRYPRF